MTGSELEYGARRAAYDIKKFRAKGIVRKIEKSRRYEMVPDGLGALTALLILRDKVITPLLAASRKPAPSAQPANPTILDHHYESFRASMHRLFTQLGVAT